MIGNKYGNGAHNVCRADSTIAEGDCALAATLAIPTRRGGQVLRCVLELKLKGLSCWLRYYLVIFSDFWSSRRYWV